MKAPERIIDAHHHLWDLNQVHYPWLEARGVKRFFGDPTPIQQTYDVADFQADWDGLPVTASVHIQVGTAPGAEFDETAWLAETARRHGRNVPTALVVFCDLSHENAAAMLDRHLAISDRVRGVRQIVGRHPAEDANTGSDRLIDDPAWRRGLDLLAARGLSFDLQLIPSQLTRMAAVLRQRDSLPVALCHCGSPWEQRGEGFALWRRGLKELAALPNVSVKLSGLGMFDHGWTADRARPVVETVLELFGVDRVMAGSNVPVDKLYKSYREIWDTFDALTAGLSPHERAAIFHDTAARFYRLET